MFTQNSWLGLRHSLVLSILTCFLVSSGDRRLGPDPSSAFSNSFHTVLFMVQEWLEGHRPDGGMVWSKGSLFSISTESQPSLTQKAGMDGG